MQTHGRLKKMTPKILQTLGATVSKTAKVHYALSETNTTNREQRRKIAKAERRKS